MTSETLQKLRETSTGTPEFDHIFIRDIKRCPYAPHEYGYETWTRADNQRLKELSDLRCQLRKTAQAYLSHKEREVRDMAIFICWLLEEQTGV